MCLVGALSGRVTIAGAGEGHSNWVTVRVPALSVPASSHSVVRFICLHLVVERGTEKSSLCSATQRVNSRAKMGRSYQNTTGTEKYLHNAFHTLLTPKQIRQVELRIIQAHCM